MSVPSLQAIALTRPEFAHWFAPPEDDEEAYRENVALYLDMLKREFSSLVLYYGHLAWLSADMLRHHHTATAAACGESLRRHGQELGRRLRPDALVALGRDPRWLSLVSEVPFCMAILEACPSLFFLLPEPKRFPENFGLTDAFYIHAVLRALLEDSPLNHDAVTYDIHKEEMSVVFTAPQFSVLDRNAMLMAYALQMRDFALCTYDDRFDLIELYATLPALHGIHIVLDPRVCSLWLPHLLDPVSVLHYLRKRLTGLHNRVYKAKQVMRIGPRGRVETLIRFYRRLCMLPPTACDAAIMRLDQDVALQAFLRRFDRVQFDPLRPCDASVTPCAFHTAVGDFVRMCVQVSDESDDD